MVAAVVGHPRTVARALGLLVVAAGAYLRPVEPAAADVLIAIAYGLAGVVLGYMGAQIAPQVFQRRGPPA